MQSEKGKGVWRSLMSLWLYSSGHSSRPSSVVELSVRLRPGGLRRDRHRSLPMVENEAWCRRRGSNPHDHTVKGF